jgi:hypothetical protein
MALSLLVAVLWCNQAAWAAGPALVAKVDGRAYIVRGSTARWLACWAEQADGKSKLFAIDANNGNVQLVATEELPGGICWIPGRDELLWCRGVYNKVIDVTLVTYYVYDAVKNANRKVIETTDITQAYQGNMLAADDGSSVFHLTISGGGLASFNVYYPAGGTQGAMQLNQVEAKIGAQYDLSSDGARLYWLLHDPKTSTMDIAVWKLADGKYESVIEYPQSKDLADAHVFLKVDTPNQEAAAIVASVKDPRLALCVYSLGGKPVIPVYLQPDEQVEYYDWKGRSGMVYALINNSQTKKYSIEEIDPLTGARKKIYATSDMLYCLEYGPGPDYFITWIDERNPKRIQTHILRLKQ